MQKYVPLVKQNVMKLEVFILGGQRIDQKRTKGWWRGRRGTNLKIQNPTYSLSVLQGIDIKQLFSS